MISSIGVCRQGKTAGWSWREYKNALQLFPVNPVILSGWSWREYKNALQLFPVNPVILSGWSWRKYQNALQ